MTVVSIVSYHSLYKFSSRGLAVTSATIRDVANTAGVSIKTVSRVLNNEPFVKKSTRDKVVTAIDELGYVASMPARRLAKGQSYTIGLIFHNASWHYTQDVLRGVIETARKAGFSTLPYPCDVCSDIDTKEVLNLVHQRVVDGLIFTPPADNSREVIHELQQLEVPFVRLTPQDRTSPLPYVTATDLVTIGPHEGPGVTGSTTIGTAPSGGGGSSRRGGGGSVYIPPPECTVDEDCEEGFVCVEETCEEEPEVTVAETTPTEETGKTTVTEEKEPEPEEIPEEGLGGVTGQAFGFIGGTGNLLILLLVALLLFLFFWKRRKKKDEPEFEVH